MLNENSIWMYLLRLLLFVAGAGLAIPVFSILVNKPLDQYHLPQIGLEWESTPEGMEKQLGNLAPQGKTGLSREELIKRLDISLKYDSRGFIPFYIMLFFVIALHIKKMDVINGNLYLYSIMACILFAAVADWMENDLIWKSVSAEAGETYLRSKVLACALKWGLIALAVFLVSFGFLGMNNLWVAIPGLIAAGVMLIGVFGPHYLIQWAFGLLGILLAVCAVHPA